MIRADSRRARAWYLTVIVVGVVVFTAPIPLHLRAGQNPQLSQKEYQDSELVDRGTVSYPLKGHIALTNVGKPVSGMLVECYVHGWKKQVAATKTNSSGDFSFPDLPEGKYYLRLSGVHVFTVRTIVTTTRKSTNVLSMITEGCDRDCDSDPVLGTAKHP